MTTSSETVTIALDEIEETTRHALTRHGASSIAANEVAHAVRTAEAKGNRICGLYYLESYCNQLTSGRVDGVIEPQVTIDRPGAVRVDAGYGFAQPAFKAGFADAVQSAQANGICGYSIEHSHTCTSLGYFTEQFARAGMIALGSTNSTARVSPPGGSKPLLGTNPIAFAVPGPDNTIAFQFDFSTSAIALGKITMAAAAGEPIPTGWAVDEHGNDTTDPHAALGGSLLSAGGYKGYGLGLLVEVLASALTGSLPSAGLAPLKATEGPHHDLGQFYVVIDPMAYSGQDFFTSIEQLATLVAAQEGARLPGANESLPDAVAIDQQLWAATLALAEG